MPRFAANLTTMYNEFSFLDRFAAAAKDGFTAVEYMFPYDFPADTLAALLREHGLIQVLFNAPAGNWAAGERGLTCLPDRVEDFRREFLRALDYARVLKCPRIHTMAGIAPAGVERARLRDACVANLAWAADQARPENIDVIIEPIAQRNMPGFFLNLQEEGHAIVAETGKANVKVLMDLFHCQVAEGDLSAKMRKYIENPAETRVGHIQFAGVPGRHEPDAGELNYDFLFNLIDELGFKGWVGCEYIPRGGTSEGLDWFRKRQAASN